MNNYAAQLLKLRREHARATSYIGKVGNEGPMCIEPLADPERDLAL